MKTNNDNKRMSDIETVGVMLLVRARNENIALWRLRDKDSESESFCFAIFYRGVRVSSAQTLCSVFRCLSRNSMHTQTMTLYETRRRHYNRQCVHGSKRCYASFSCDIRRLQLDEYCRCRPLFLCFVGRLISHAFVLKLLSFC